MSEEYEEYGRGQEEPLNEPVQPLNVETPFQTSQRVVLHRRDSSNSNISGFASKAHDAESMVSSKIGHTYFDKHIRRESGAEAIEQNRCNRIYSWCNLLHFILQCLLIAVLVYQYRHMYKHCDTEYQIYSNDTDCYGQITECEHASAAQCIYNESLCQCLPSFHPYLLFILVYSALFILHALNIIYRGCLTCYALGEGTRNKKLFVKGAVLHHVWMDRIADNCCIPVLFALCACCCMRKNDAIRAYWQCTDESKTFPTNTSFWISIIFKSLNVLFCGAYFYFYGDFGEIDFIVIGIAALFVVSLVLSINRCRLKRRALFQKRRASMTKLSMNL